MTVVQGQGMTYKEYLKEVRAKQFGYEIEEPTSITDGTTVTVPKTKPKTTRRSKKDE